MNSDDSPFSPDNEPHLSAESELGSSPAHEERAGEPAATKTRDLRAMLVKERSVRRFSLFENMLLVFSPSERLVLYVFTILLGISSLALLAGLNAAVSVTVPSAGGALIEGEVGPVRFINPILTLSQADQDLTLLVYSGLTRALPSAGSSGLSTIVPDLASHYELSEDGTTYTFTIRSDATFHDGTPVTAEDVIFTVEAAQNPLIKSPRRADWEGVRISSPDAHTVVFTLARPYAPFIENTTLGILPKHVWQNVPPEEFPFDPANTHPIGSGPYRLESETTDATGSITSIGLLPFKKFALGKAYLKRITFLFYPNHESMIKAFDAGKIDAMAGITPADLEKIERTDFAYVHAPLPRIFGVFFNQNHAPVLADDSARAALEAAVDKQQIVSNVLGGYGSVLDGPIPPGVVDNALPAIPVAFTGISPTVNATSTEEISRADEARSILSRGGWKYDEEAQVWMKGKQELSLALATADEPELVATAQAVADDWRAAGVKVAVQVYSLSELNTSVIRPRAYDAVLFGEVVGRTADLFAFWHSSQRNDPGLNLTLYTNLRVDTLLSQARATTDEKKRESLYEEFTAAVVKDQPAIFLYAPQFVYVVPQGMGGIRLGALTSASERFLNVYEWYTDTERVWSIFTSKNN